VTNQGVIIYDGACPFCLKQVARIQRRDPGRIFEYVPRQTPGLEQRYPRLAEGEFITGMRLVHPDGRISVGADAVYGIARRLRPWRYAAWLYRVPGLRQLARAAYAWVAANRQRLGRSCDDGACRVE
jgi:predicted DCC family thiol-disulfide oxidoreductase YuxK